MSLLLVEDDDGDAKAVIRAFRRAKVANPVHRAVDGVEALEILRGGNGREPLPAPFIILADINMPRMDGIKFVHELRADPQLKSSIVFMLTTSKSEEDKVKAYNLNVAGYIVKETAGRDFLKLVDMLGAYWRIVELPNADAS
ncbi:response regulator [Rhizobium sp. L1K21]|uniref:response regulator n=1 Tax=Rhizobium sp. L1K21 TaxID=2954933 RepID=UPI0020925E05|nr:response regulator [Rhizobium sp. L1K21]MCO6188301.1 response regulator [Rhizobium sp. L1K21]